MPNWFAYITDAPSKKPMLDCATNMLNGKIEDNQIMKINFSLLVAIVHAQHSTDICGQKSVPYENPKETRVRLGGPG